VLATQPAAWGLRITKASSGQTRNPFGAQPSGAPLGTPNIASAKAVAIRQWIHGSGPVTTGPLPEGIFSVIDRAAHYRSAADAHALLADLSSGFGTGSSQPVAGIPGATDGQGIYRRDERRWISLGIDPSDRAGTKHVWETGETIRVAHPPRCCSVWA
jgi:hypothetical protein